MDRSNAWVPPLISADGNAWVSLLTNTNAKVNARVSLLTDTNAKVNSWVSPLVSAEFNSKGYSFKKNEYPNYIFEEIFIIVRFNSMI